VARMNFVAFNSLDVVGRDAPAADQPGKAEREGPPRRGLISGTSTSLGSRRVSLLGSPALWRHLFEERRVPGLGILLKAGANPRSSSSC
jgi:hypothetical protein